MEFELTNAIQYTVIEYDETVDHHDIDNINRFRFRVQRKSFAQLCIQIGAHLVHIQGTNHIVIHVINEIDDLVVGMVIWVKVNVLVHDFHRTYGHAVAEAIFVDWIAEVIVQ